MLKNLVKRLTNNLGLKVLAALFAFILWVVVINVDEPVRTVPYTVSVKTENEDYITSNGKYFELLDGNNTVTFNVSAKRTYQEKLSNADFSAVADMEKIEYVDDSGIYRVPVTVSCSKFSSNQVTISSKQLYIEVAMEDRGTVQKRITATTTGNVADGCAIGEVSIVTTNLLKITGPSSVTSMIDTVEANINVEGMNSDVTDTVVPVLYDADRNVIDTTKLKLSINTVTVSAQILKTKDVPVEFATTGTVAKNYMVEGIEYAPDTVRIKGEASVLNTVSKVTVPAEVLDVTNATGDVKTTVDISSYLPNGVSLVLASDAQIEVTVKIEPLVEKSFEIPVSALTVENLPENQEISFLLDSLTVEIAGAESDMKKLSEDDIQGVIDASGLEKGEHNVTVTILLDEELYQTTSTITIPVNVKDLNEEEDNEDSEKSVVEENSDKTEKTSKKNQ
ncbi:MAG: CdaR family protein [Clostridiales bacterium]|nr:CdaR family protein [Clostridiales bacterium]